MVYIVPLQKSDLEQTIRCMSSSFSQETMSQALGIDVNSYLTFAEMFCQRAIKYNLSLVAKDEKTGDVIGFTILEDFLSEFPNIDGIDSRFIPIINLINELDEWYIKNYTVKLGEILHIFMTGIYEEYRGKGIAHQLMEKTFQVAKNNHFQKIIAECTGAVTQHIRAKYGFKTLKEIDYQTFVYNGELIFKNIKDIPTCKLMLKTLD